jgi:hypothetical protein
MFTSFSISLKLDIRNFSLFVYKVISVNLKLVLYFQQLSVKGRVLFIY